VEQVSTAIVSIDDAMHQISESTGQLSEAANGSNKLGVELKDLVQYYTL
jgi:methyl-accepting chemotaxis protein